MKPTYYEIVSIGFAVLVIVFIFITIFAQKFEVIMTVLANISAFASLAFGVLALWIGSAKQG